jgi:hypothetical protein
MAKLILLDEFHLSVQVPDSLARSSCASLRRILNGKRMQARLREAVGHVLRQYPSLQVVKWTLSR